ncbi:disease resistance protein Pik-1-like isoform X2 [Euphorbia lathyris]|uniref:disease resistance protein Pik-1-like isoform X2 n=1 Tax=Euphorbia lathyris TaxID=212925 RepID=UPI0033136DD8
MASPSHRYTAPLSPSHRYTASLSPAKTRNVGPKVVLKPHVVSKKTIVLKVLPLFDTKSQSKALQIAAGILGVESARFLGNDKGHIEVVGVGVDAAEVANLLRKKLGHAEIISVSVVEVKK